MDKKAIVTINSRQIVNGEEETIELITAGRFYSKENGYYIVYEETEISGMQGTTTTVRISGDSVSIIRFGTTSSRLNFKKGVRDISLYKTPYGVMEIEVMASLLEIDVGDGGGSLKICYELSTGGQKSSANELLIKIQGRE
jgi:uncharacterized beta-barrel protein YwiB (DUF1934 family)